MIKTNLVVIFLIANLLSSTGFTQVPDNFTRLKLNGFPGCVLKVLSIYPGVIAYVEAERAKKKGSKSELFYEFEVKLKENDKHIEIECNPNSLILTDLEEEVNITDKRFSEKALISLEKAKVILKEITKGKIIEYETSLENGQPVYEFDVFESDLGIEVEYEIDGITGLLLESEVELFEIGLRTSKKF